MVRGGDTVLYRLYDGRNVLLYVGITEELPKRLLRHSARLWWPEVHTVCLEAYESRTQALRAESRAIAVEGPLHNRLRPEPDEDEPAKPLTIAVLSIEEVRPRPRLRLRNRAEGAPG